MFIVCLGMTFKNDDKDHPEDCESAIRFMCEKPIERFLTSDLEHACDL